MFTNPFSNAFGLDLGDLSIKLVQLRNRSFLHKTPRYDLVNFRSTSLPAGLIVDGELQKPEEVRKKIQYLLNGDGKKNKAIKSPWVVACLPETQTFIKLIEAKKTAEELTEDDIKTIAKKHIPFEDDGSYYLEWQVMPGAKDSVPILIGAVPKKVSDSYVYLLESLGLGVVALEIEALSIARSLITVSKEYNNEARALLDLGATRSSLIVYDHDIIQFSTTIPFSGEILTLALAQKLNIDLPEAESLKIKTGLNYENDKNKIWAILNTETESLIKHINNAIQFYYSHFENANRITRITMCGGSANIKNLDKVLSTKLKILCRPGHSWKNLNSPNTIPMSDAESLTYTTAIGLALRAADNPFLTHGSI